MLRGLNRGSFSFVALLVINPIVILFYQNCTMAPLGQNRVGYNSRVHTPLKDGYLGVMRAESGRVPASLSVAPAMDSALPTSDRSALPEQLKLHDSNTACSNENQVSCLQHSSQ